MVKALHRAGIEVILDVVFNHTAEGEHDGPTFCFRGLDNRAYYMLDADRPRTLDYTGCGNTLNANHSDRPPDDPRQPALLGRARCTSTASASTWRRSSPATRPGTPMAEPAGPLGDRVGPGAGRHQADRRGLGRRRAVPGRHVRRRHAGPSGTAGSATTSAASSAATRHVSRAAPTGLSAAPTSTAHEEREAGAERQLRHLPRRLHAQRPRLLQPQAQRGQRRGQPRRHRRQPQLELRRRRADRRSGRRGAAQPAGEELPRLTLLLAGHADDPDGRRGPADAAGQQQRLLPGQRDQLVRLGRSPGVTPTSGASSEGSSTCGSPST